MNNDQLDGFYLAHATPKLPGPQRTTNGREGTHVDLHRYREIAGTTRLSGHRWLHRGTCCRDRERLPPLGRIREITASRIALCRGCDRVDAGQRWPDVRLQVREWA